MVEVAARLDPQVEPAIAGRAISKFGVDLFTAVRSASPADENVAVSPVSVAVALAMLEPGTVGEARSQLRDLLRINDPAVLHASMNALQRSLEARVAAPLKDGDDPGEVTMRIANAAYLQHGGPFRPAYLEAVGSNYGPVLNEVDFSSDPDAVAHDINAFVADATNDCITDLVADGAIKPDTVLALVNALYLKASWLQPFDEAATTDGVFTMLDGAETTVPMMHGRGSTSAHGDGWAGVTKTYSGGLSAQFILPDEGRFDEIVNDLRGVFAAYDAHCRDGATLAMPRLETRFSTELSVALTALGLTAPYGPGGLLGIANDPGLVINQVLHESFVAMDEDGTEAAAATVILALAGSFRPDRPAPLTLDRPFLYRIIDNETGATLFIGQVLDPIA